MSQNWPMVPLGQLLSPVSREESVALDRQYNILGAHWYAKGLYTKETKSGSDIAASKVYRVEEGDFVYNRLFAWKGSFALATADNHGCYVSNEFPCFAIDRERLEPGFILHYFSRGPAWTEALGLSSGGTPTSRNRLKEAMMLGMTIPLPPLPEQRRIVVKVEKLAAKIEEARRLRHLTQNEAEWMAAAALRSFRKGLLGGEHRVVRLGEITTVTAGGTPSRDNPGYWGGNIRWVKTGELIDGDISSTEEHLTEAGLNSSSAKLFPPDTILIALYGQGQTRGRTGRLVVEAATNQACCAILPTTDLLEPRYTQYWLRSLYYELREQCYGGAQPNWSGRMIKLLKIALPPLALQRRIVAHLDALQAKVDALKALQAHSAAELDALLPSVLDKAFKGEL